MDKELLIAEARAYFNMQRLLSEYDPMLGIYLEDMGRNALANDAVGKLRTERKIKLCLKDLWISVKDRLPDRECNVLGYFPADPPMYQIRVIRFVPADEDTEAFFVIGIDDLEAFPSHWMEIKRPL